MIVFDLQNMRGNTRDTIKSSWHVWHHRIRDWQLVSKACYFSRVNMYNIDSRCRHPRISASYFSTGVSSTSMILQIIEKKWVVLQALWSPLRVVDTRTKIKPKITLDFKVRLACIGRCQDIGHWNVWFDQGSLNVEVGLSSCHLGVDFFETRSKLVCQRFFKTRSNVVQQHSNETNRHEY